MPKHSRGRGARIVFLPPADAQVELLSPYQAERLDLVLERIAAAPDAVKPHATASALRDYQQADARVIFYATALGSIIIVTYVEVD
ncbi:hypothetical protein [Streptomyces melanogenes]|uniref:hypothetical protein n=1 Tax=Streptomyces melanogenes TaxID=67326 RepID=UPI00167CA622|nr:hypothetical protein [Streptomyces melanogenes]GGP78467.1 hypothetical protein GCM10010278_66130 [Streptomyces melanogenes]